MRSQRRKLRFACNQKRRTLPVRIAWQGAGAWVSHCDTRVPIEATNFVSQTIFQLSFKTSFLHVSGQWDKFQQKKNPTFKCIVTSQSPSIAMRSQRRKLPFACNQRRRTLPVRIAWQGAGTWVSHCDASYDYESTNRGQNFFVKKFWKN